VTFGDYLRRERRIAKWTIQGGVGLMCLVGEFIATTRKDPAMIMYVFVAGAVVTFAALTVFARRLRCPRCRASLYDVRARVLTRKAVSLQACPRCGLRTDESFTPIVS
jgi:hypothetical protein